MANTTSGGTGAGERQWIPTIILDEERREARVYCTDNIQAIVAVELAAERGLTARRFRAAADSPAPILIKVTDERTTVRIAVISMAELVWGPS